MARMKTGRMTAKMSGPGDGIVVTSKKESIKPRELSSREAQYNADVAAGEKYKSDLGSYNKNMKTYNESKTNSRSYAHFGGGPVDVSAEGLKQYNSLQSDGLKATRIQRPKAAGSESDYLKRISSEKGGFVGHVDYEKPTAPVKPKAPNHNDIPMDKMAMLKVTGVKTKQSLAAPKKEKSSEGWFGDYNPNTKGASNKQLKQFASYASKTGLNESFIAKSKAEIGQYKNEMKSQRRAYAKEGNLAGVKATTADIRQSRNAAKFVGSKNPLDVAGMAVGYQKSEDHAANRNTIKSQVERLKKLR